MKRASGSKALTACILTILLSVPFIPASFSNFTSARAKAATGTRLTNGTTGKPAQQFRTVLRTFAPFWEIGAGYSSTLIVRNSDSQLPVSATPIIFTTDKEQIRLATLQLAPNEVKKISLEKVVRTSGSAAESGALALEMDTSQSGSIIAEMIINSYEEGVIFDLPLLAGYANDDAKALHAAWWLPDEGTEGEVILFNASEQSIVAHPSITLRRKQHALADVNLAAHEVKKLDLRDLIPQSGKHQGEQGAETGAITVSYEGPAHALLPALLLSNDKTGFSLTGKFFAKRPEQPIQSETTNWYYPIVLTGKASSGLGFKKGSKFTPYALINNPTSNSITPQIELSFAADGESTQSVSLPVRPLAPMETRLVDLSDATKELLPNDVSSFSLRLSHTGAAGELALHIFSMEQKKNFVFTADGTLQTRSRLDSVYWNIEDDLQVMLVVENTGNSAVQAQATLSYDSGDGVQGTYQLPPMELPARATRAVNLKQIISAGRPDEAGRVIPHGTSFGTVTVRANDGQGREVLAGGTVTFDPDAGQYGVFFLPMCSPSGPRYAFGGFPFGYTIYLDGIELPSCDFLLPIIIITVCELFCGTDLGLPPQIDSITPDRALIGQPVDVVIRGSSFGNGPSLSVDAGISASITSASSTQINARFNISASDVGGNHAVFVENSQGISNAVNFFVQIPKEFIPLSLTPVNLGCGTVLDPSGNPVQTVGFGAQVLYQVADQLGQPIQFAGLTPQEHFTVTDPTGTHDAFPGFKPFATPPTTNASGQFLDTPVGTCFLPSPTNGCIVRRQTFKIAVGAVIFDIPTVTSSCDCLQGLGIRVITGTNVRSATLGTIGC